MLIQNHDEILRKSFTAVYLKTEVFHFEMILDVLFISARRKQNSSF